MLSARSQLLSLAALLFCIAGFGTVSYGHALQPGYLELRLVDTDQYSVLWKKPANRGKPVFEDKIVPRACVM